MHSCYIYSIYQNVPFSRFERAKQSKNATYKCPTVHIIKHKKTSMETQHPHLINAVRSSSSLASLPASS